MPGSLPRSTDHPCAQCAKQAVEGGRRSNGQGSITAAWGPVRTDGTRPATHFIKLRVRGQQWRQQINATHAEAVRILKDKQAEVANNGVPASRSVTVGDLVQQYVDMSRIKNREGTTGSYVELYEQHIAPSPLDDVRLARLTDADVQAFVNERFKTGQKTGDWGARRVKMMADLLRSSFNLGMRRRPRLIGWNPLGKHGAVVLPEVRTPKIRGLNHQQAMALLERIAGHEHEHLYWLLLATGLRIGEALGLQWSDIDLVKQRVRVEHKLKPGKQRTWKLDDPKTEAGVRVIPLIPDAVEHLRAQLDRKLRRLQPDFVFIDALGEPYTQDSVRSHMVIAAHQAGIRRPGPKLDITPHDLRRSAATFLHGQGVPLAAIQHILGHTSISTTLRYIDGASEDMLDQVYEGWEQAFTKLRATRV